MRPLPPLLAALAALALVAGPAVAQSAAPTSMASPVAAGPAPSFGAAWHSVPCDEFRLKDTVAAISDCGYVTVPENRAAGTDSTIELAVVRLRSSSADPGVPMFVGTGGPGGSAFDFLDKDAPVDYAKMVAPILADRDVVRWSQRGTQYAKPFLACPGYDAIDLNAALEGWTREEKDAQITSTLQACKDEFVAQGVDLSAYDSDENAADIVDVKDALGYDTIAYYGQSYGTLLGQFLMRNHPEILESVILDGIAPVVQTRYDELVDIPAAFQRLYDACAAQETCKAQFPDVAGTIEQVVANLDAEPLKVTVPAEDGTEQALSLGSKAVLDYLLGQLYQGGKTVPMDAVNLLANPASYSKELTPSAGGGTFARMQHFAINCSDDPDQSMEQFELDKDPAYLRDFLYDDGIREVLACQVLGVPQLPDSSDVLVTSELPALLLNGALDPATAAENGRTVEKGLPNSQYVLFPAGGHVQDQDPCAVTIIAAFLKDPTATVDTSCITPAGQLAALTPVTLTSEDGSASMTLTIIRPTWREVTPGTPGAYDLSGQIQFEAKVLPPSTTPDQAIKDAMAQIATVEDSQITDTTEPIAGQRARTVSLEATVQGMDIAADSYAFSTPSATYVITFVGYPPLGTGARVAYPPILKSIEVDPAP